MRVTSFTRNALSFRRQERDLKRLGYERAHEPCWELDRGFRTRERIVDVKIDTTGKSLYILVSDKAREHQSA